LTIVALGKNTFSYKNGTLRQQHDKTKNMTLEDELPPRSLGVKYVIGEEQRNSSRKNEEAGPKQKQCSVVNVSGGDGKV